MRKMIMGVVKEEEKKNERKNWKERIAANMTRTLVSKNQDMDVVSKVSLWRYKQSTIFKLCTNDAAAFHVFKLIYYACSLNFP
jgi:hypothetical protein